MADLSEYTFFDGVELREDVKTLMQIFEDSWEECREEDCRQCKYRHGKEQYALLACISERYAENLIDAEVAPVRHGRWVNANNRKKTYQRRCTSCGEIAYYCGIGCSYKFCPNCGCCMDGGVSDA